MSRVRKDILNGWKEIGGYVCRDIRTVERWEKSRGLPVRRVPGAGRATVYALISEVDEWLASTKLDESDDSSVAISQPASDEQHDATSTTTLEDAEEGARATAIRAFENAAKLRAESKPVDLQSRSIARAGGAPESDRNASQPQVISFHGGRRDDCPAVSGRVAADVAGATRNASREVAPC